jgi:hypothetical protein
MHAETHCGSTSIKNQKSEALNIQGIAELEDVQCSSFEVVGTAELQNVNVSGPTKVVGSAEFKQCVLGRLEIFGECSFDGLTVQKKTLIQGNVEKGADGHFHELEVMGKFSVKKKCSCEGPFKIVGPMTVTSFTAKSSGEIIGTLVAKKSQFEGLTITAKEMEFSDCQIKEIHVKALTQASETQVLKLKGKTQVANGIVFDSGKGLVVIGKKAKIEGIVRGGKIQQEE